MSKIAIVGAGHVGVTLAYACLIRGTGKTIALYGRNTDKLCADVLDLQHGVQFVPMATVSGSGDIEVCRDADVLVVTAGGVPRPGHTRLDLAAESVAICRDLLPPLLDVAPDAVVIIVSNPVDVVTYAALKILGLPPGYQILRGKGYTNYAVALATARIIEAVLYDEHQVLPVSSLLTGYAGMSDVCLSVPSVVGRTGVLRVLPVPLSEDERRGLHRSAHAVRAVIDQLGPLDLAVHASISGG